jgi:hypothetical protein
MVLQEELEHSYLCKLAGWCWNSFKLISFFQRRSPKVSAVGRLHYDCYHYTSKFLELETIINVRLLDFAHNDKHVFIQCLSRALRKETPRLLMAASTLLLPFQPLMVSAVHTGMMEVSIISDQAFFLAKRNCLLDK